MIMGILSDLVAAKRSLQIGQSKVELRGLSLDEIGTLLSRFEDLRMELAAAFAAGGLNAMVLLKKISVEAAAGIIAAGVGKLGDRDEESAAAELALGVQIDLIDQIIVATLPNGDGPLAKRLAEFASQWLKAAEDLLRSENPPAMSRGETPSMPAETGRGAQ
jgi:hypothetical protein